MSADQERLSTVQWILERQIGWIATADVKVGAVVAIHTAMAGTLAATFGSASNRSEYAVVATVIAFVCAIGALVCSAYALFPRTNGPEKSLLFFGKISSLSRPDYVSAIRTITVSQLIDDCAEQIHRNAEIAKEKHRWVQNGLVWSFLAALPWAVALFELAPLKVS